MIKTANILLVCALLCSSMVSCSWCNDADAQESTPAQWCSTDSECEGVGK